jgi:hypothetical protein
MSVKLLLLKSGEDVIANVREMTVEERTIGYFLNAPYIVKIIDGDVTNENVNNISKQVSLTFYPYIPLSEQKEIPIPSDWVVTMVEPINQVKEMYNQRIVEKSKNGESEKNDQSIVPDKQFDTDRSN